MKNKIKQKIKNIFLLASQAYLQFWLFYLLHPPKWQRTVNGVCSQSITVPLWFSFILTLFPSFFFSWCHSHRIQFIMNCFNVDPFHGLQFFENCFSVGPFHGLQSFMNRPFQHGSTYCSVGSTPGCSVDFCSTVVVHGLYEDNLLHHCLLHWTQGNLCSELKHFFPLHLHWPWYLQGCFSHIIHTPLFWLLPHSVFYPFLDMLSQRSHQHHWWAQLCPALSHFWSWLELLVSSHRSHPHSPSATKTCHVNSMQLLSDCSIFALIVSIPCCWFSWHLPLICCLKKSFWKPSEITHLLGA